MDVKLAKAMNEQIVKELYSAYLYLSMAAYFAAKSLNGFNHWMQMQAQEELIHAMVIFNFMNDRGNRVVFGPIDRPDADFNSVADVFEKTLAHEKKVSKMINDIYKIAEDVNDNAAKIKLQWFMKEQVEEERTPGDILAKLLLVKSNPAAILMIDKDMSARLVPTMPVL